MCHLENNDQHSIGCINKRVNVLQFDDWNAIILLFSFLLLVGRILLSEPFKETQNRSFVYEISRRYSDVDMKCNIHEPI